MDGAPAKRASAVYVVLVFVFVSACGGAPQTLLMLRLRRPRDDDAPDARPCEPRAPMSRRQLSRQICLLRPRTNDVLAVTALRNEHEGCSYGVERLAHGNVVTGQQPHAGTCGRRTKHVTLRKAETPHGVAARARLA